MKKTFIFAAALAMACALVSCKSEEQKLSELVDKALEASAVRAHVLAENVLPEEGLLPRTFEDGKLQTCSYPWWVSGFFPGTLWMLSEQFPADTLLRTRAEEFTARAEPAQWLTNTHDLGFMIYCSAGQGYRLTGSQRYLDDILNACKSLSTRYNPKVGLIMSWNPSEKWRYPVIIDNMMNLEMLMFGAEKSGNDSLRTIALSHAEKTIRNHFRQDYSSYHVVSYNPETGEAEAHQTAQGYADESAWARGQAWGLYGYTMMYRMSGKPEFLEQARHIAAFIADNPNLPEDGIPYWDFNAPDIPSALRDASAGAVMASAYLELSTYVEGEESERWKNLAVKQIKTLSSPEYLAGENELGGFILKHSVGNKPKNSEVDVPLTYADYYYVEALVRLKSLLSAD